MAEELEITVAVSVLSQEMGLLGKSSFIDMFIWSLRQKQPSDGTVVFVRNTVPPVLVPRACIRQGPPKGLRCGISGSPTAPVFTIPSSPEQAQCGQQLVRDRQVLSGQPKGTK